MFRTQSQCMTCRQRSIHRAQYAPAPERASAVAHPRTRGAAWPAAAAGAAVRPGLLGWMRPGHWPAPWAPPSTPTALAMPCRMQPAQHFHMLRHAAAGAWTRHKAPCSSCALMPTLSCILCLCQHSAPDIGQQSEDSTLQYCIAHLSGSHFQSRSRLERGAASWCRCRFLLGGVRVAACSSGGAGEVPPPGVAVLARDPALGGSSIVEKAALRREQGAHG